MATKKKAATKKSNGNGKKATAIRTWLGFVLDKSSSMSTQRQAAIDGFNEFLSEQKKVSDDTKLSLVLFDTTVTTVYAGKPLNECPEMTERDYIPSGMTALWDAVAQAAIDIEKLASPGDRILITVFTDGEENSSREIHSSEQMAAFIKERESRGNWTFAGMGSAKDFVTHATKMGIGAANVAKIDPNNVYGGVLAMASATRALRGSSMMSYTGGTGLYDPNNANLTAEDKAKLKANLTK